MFGALNRFISRLDAEPLPNNQPQNANDTSFGFQVLRNTNPDLQIEPWFDFIIGLNGHYIDSPDPSLFLTEIRNCAGAQCSFELWSAKGQRTHALTVPIQYDIQSLGLSLQLAPLESSQNIWHVLTIPSPLSPAHQAGLLPHSDYILGSPSGVLRGEGALGELVEDHLNRSLTLWVYNSEFDVVREVELIPRRGWGGEGALGAVLGYGALHRLPLGLGEEVQAPGENMFEADRKSLETYTTISEKQATPEVLSPPAATPLSPPPMMNPNAPPPSRGTGQKNKKTRHAPVPGFDDMFAEGAKKSAERDLVPSRKGTPSAPPPRQGSVAPSQSGSAIAQDEEELGEPGEAEVT
ncbi:hypothetical protein LTR70_003696 [Exophiala xenobiotica]|uniref:PDZ GRASP-type domain-containing protein n=1 Tax=Lithohypha guttulata TaxID=1690604 RepID=A0ABR0KJX9_9EURO|nr:hypothetical protein LTR24_002343 [Lithohypha guttulata]KAK5322748.1 hypothetical protein LTR70_003696 [Exophiala xenobiotica]